MAAIFDEVRLPDDVERGATGGPMFKTTVITLSSGHEKRNQDWAETRGEWDIGYGIQTKENMTDVIKFFYARRGRARGFRFKDWSDFEMEKQAIGVGDSVNAIFQIYKRYTSGSVDYDRVLNKIVADTIEVYVNNVLQAANRYTINLNTGIITFLPGFIPGPVPVAAACEFDVPVRFDTDKLGVSMQTFDAGSIPQINVVELKQ